MVKDLVKKHRSAGDLASACLHKPHKHIEENVHRLVEIDIIDRIGGDMLENILQHFHSRSLGYCEARKMMINVITDYWDNE